MDTNKYKYDPEQFNNMFSLTDELKAFYEQYEKYLLNKTREQKLALEKLARDMFFTIKHRRIEGVLSQSMAQEIIEYLEELLDD
ncbi:MAG: hypothetical protein FWG88_11690 [Oscillospiraceae bacterium]|nr:hypothetical protein [Oscillospiraceae bacterium]